MGRTRMWKKGGEEEVEGSSDRDNTLSNQGPLACHLQAQTLFPVIEPKPCP